jgi:hypothetical protein
LAALAQSHCSDATACAAATAAVSSHALAAASLGMAAMPTPTTNAASTNDFISLPPFGFSSRVNVRPSIPRPKGGARGLEEKLS